MNSSEFPTKKHSVNTLERRFITVMFCDMVGSTALSERLDPEDLNDIFHLYRDAAFKIVKKYHGHVARVIGDGLLIYFGYPKTHEDDAILAARAGLEIIASLKKVSEKTTSLYNEQISARIGIHTGLVVIENIGSGQGHEQNAVVGITPNIAARLQEVAAPNQVTISSVTWRLLKFRFTTVSIGSRQFKGIAKPIQVFNVTSYNKTRGHVSPESSEWMTPRVDRKVEIADLHSRWEEVRAGKGQTILVVGEAGIGKSRLVKEFITQLPDDSLSLLDYLGSEHYRNIAFHPIIDRLQRIFDNELLQDKQRRHQFFMSIFGEHAQEDDKIIRAFESLLTRTDSEEQFSTGLDPQDVKVAIRKAMFSFLTALAQQKPVIIWVDDFQWFDYTSREILQALFGLVAKLPILLLIASRPDPAIEKFTDENITRIDLKRLSAKDGQELCARVFDRQAPSPEVLKLIFDRSEGVPLFLEELSASILESAWSDMNNGSSAAKYSYSESDIPTSLTATIMARLERLGEARDVAQAAAVQGQVFSSEILGIICNLNSESLSKSLKLLLNAGLIIAQDEHGAHYKFKHALVKEVAEQSLVKNRRRELNLAVARAIESGDLKFATRERDLLGQYYEKAGEFKSASNCFLLAGRESVKKSTNVEALSQLRKALETLHKLPQNEERDQDELAIQVAMIGPAIAALGYAASEVETILTRALQLLEQLPSSPLIFPVLFSRWAVFQVVGKTRLAYGIAEKTFKLASALPDTGANLIAHRLLGTSDILIGRPADAISKLKRARELFDPKTHSHLVHICGTDPLVSANALLAFAMWLTGKVKESEVCAREAIKLAEEGGHANTIGYALAHVGILSALRGDVSFTSEVAERLLHFAVSKELPFWVANARAFQGWLLARRGQTEQALEIFSKGLEFLNQAGLIYWRPTYLCWVAQAYLDYSAPEKAITYLEQADNIITISEERWMESEVWRLKGVATSQLGEQLPEEDVLSYLFKAIKIAAHQKSVSLELRATVDLVRYLIQIRQTTKARDWLLKFFKTNSVESSDTEVKEAKAILEKLDDNIR